jgi:putative peptidoglycan lipid II flippase
MVKKNIIRTIRNNVGFLTRTQSTILSAAGILALSSGMTALLGLVKSRLLTSYFGVSPDLSVFFTADRIPNLLYSLFVVGALSTVFIPVYSEAIKEKGEEAHEVASMIISAGVLIFLLLGGLAFIFAKSIIKVVAVNQFTPEEIMLGANLMRLMLGAQIILVVSSFITSMLQTHNYFLLPSLAPVLYNLGMIVGILTLTERFGIYGPTYGILLGAAAHLIIQTPALRKISYKYKFNLNFKNIFVKKIGRLLPPRMLSVFIASGMGTVHNSLALLISKPSVVYLKFADQLQTFPVSLFGYSIAAAALPALSRKAYPLNKAKFKKILVTSLHQVLFLVIPCAVILLILRVPVIRIIYGAARFPWESTVKTSYTLAFFSLSIPTQSAVLLLTRSFYALRDTVTPVKIGATTAALNLALCLIFINVLGWGAWSIAFAFSITSGIDMVTMLFVLNKRLGGFNIKELLEPFIKVSYAAAMMGMGLYIPLKLLDQYVFDTTRTIQLLGITGIAGTFGVVTYLVLTKLLQVQEIDLLYSLLRKINFRESLSHSRSTKAVAEIEN